ncbi:hypothetical protein HDV00_006766 [Rhizophlyctis rosea]|nr:hypothetical protein HDV00_006766 [Rhizophlyctis rosea]
MSETVVFPRRPGFGTTGRTIQVRTNFFPVLSLPGQDIIQYEVHVAPDANPRTNRRLYALWEDLNSNGILKNTKPVYDGRKYIYAPRALPLKDNQANFTLELPDEEEDLTRPRQYRRGPRKFRVSIRKIAEINMRRLHLFLEGKSFEAPHDAIAALDILLRHRPSMLYTTVGRCFYTPEGAALIANGAELWQGFHQSVRPSPQKMLLNLDVSATAFFEPGPLVDIVAKVLGKKHADEIRQPLTERDRQKVEKVLKNIKVITTHRGNSRRRWKIAKLTTYSASRTMFPMKEEGGREESVANYFLQRYGAPLHYEHFPCLVVGDPSKHIYLPMEVCLIIPGQRILRKLNEKQTADMIRFTCQPPHVRSNKISNGFNLMLTEDNEYLQDFNVRLGREMATVNARVLTTPMLSYHPSSREPVIAPREGAWNLRDKKVAQGATLFSWSVVVFGHERDIPVQAVQKFLRELITTCRDTGVDVRNMAPPIRHANPQGNIETILKTSYMDAGSAVSHRPQLVFCVLPNTGVPLYAEIKRVADTVIGIASQCVQAKRKSGKFDRLIATL